MENDHSKERKEWIHQAFNLEDLSDIGLFFKKFYLGVGDYGAMGYFDWKILKNYVQPGIINLIKDDGKIVSTASLTPKQLYSKGQIIDIAEIGDVYTHSDYQRQGMFSLLGNETRKEGEKRNLRFIYGLPNQAALPGWIKNNFGVIDNLEMSSFLYPLNIKHRIQGTLHWTISSIVSSLMGVLLFLNFKLRGFLYQSDKNIVAKEIFECSKDWDVFWDKAKKSYDFILNRDKRSITWRYFNNPNKYHLIGLYMKEDLIGYLAYRIITDTNIKNTVIADFLTLPGYESAISSGLNSVVDESFKLGVDNIILWCIEDNKFAETFKKKGFFKRTNVPVICYQNSFSKEIIQSSSFHFTIGDSDNI